MHQGESAEDSAEDPNARLEGEVGSKAEQDHQADGQYLPKQG